MIHLFIKLFDYFRRRRILLLVIIVSVFTGSGILISRLKFEEDITRIIPRDQQLDKISRIFREFDFIDKLIITVSSDSFNRQTSPSRLIEFANQITDSISENLCPEYVSSLMFTAGAGQMDQVYDLIYNNLPLFLNANDYPLIDSIIREEAIEEKVKGNYKTILSPASTIFKKYIVLDPLNFTALGLNKLQQFQMSENFVIYQDRFFSKDLKHLFLFVTPSSSSSETRRNSYMLDRINKYISDAAHISKGISAEYYGGVAVAVGNANRIKKDISLTVSIAIVLILLMIGLFFRRFLLFFLIFLPAIFGAAISLSLVSFISPHISAISLAIGSVLLGISIDYALHFFTHYKHVRSVKTVIDDISSPVLMSSLTTASAFLCLLFIGSKVLNDLGIFAAFSVIIASVFSLILLPQFATHRKEKPMKGRLELISTVAGFQYDKNKYIITGVFLVSLVFLFSFQRVGFEGDMYAMNYMSPELTRSEQNLNKLSDLTLNSTYIISEGKTFNEALANNEKLLPELKKLKEEGIISNYVSLSSFFSSETEQKKRIKRWNEYWTGGKKDKLLKDLQSAGTAYYFNENAFAGIKEMLNREYSCLSLDDAVASGLEMFNDWFVRSETGVLLANQVKVDRDSKQTVYSRINSDTSIIFDKSFITDKLIGILKSNFQFLLLISLSLVFCILLLYFGRIELAFIGFIPILLSWLWTVGIMGLLGIKFTIFNVIISTFVFGLGIDYSLFIMRGLLQEYKFNAKNFTSYKTSILLSGTTTIIGIGVLIFARHPALKSIAAVSIVGILSVIIISYTIQPILFRKLIRSAKPEKALPYTAFDLLIQIYRIVVVALSHMIFLVPLILGYLLPKNKNRRLRIWFYAIHSFSKIILFLSGAVKSPCFKPTENRAIYLFDSETLWGPLVLYAKMNNVINLELQNNRPGRWVDWFFGLPKKMSTYFITTEGICQKEVLSDIPVSVVCVSQSAKQNRKDYPQIDETIIHIASAFHLDVIPVFLAGIGTGLNTRSSSHLSGNVSISTAHPVSYNDISALLSTNQIHAVNEKIRNEFEQFLHKFRSPGQLSKYLLKNFIYKGPILEWYMRIKIRLEKNYQFFHEILPEKGKITDIGCGYGSMAYMLGLLSPEREMYGIDYDEKKILVANHCHAKASHIHFMHGDVEEIDLPQSHVFILSDVLHYLPYQGQERLIITCVQKLKPGGKIVIREADRELQSRHLMTRLSEFLSTRLGFNKTWNEKGILYFPTGLQIQKLLTEHGLDVKVFDNTRITSNLIVIAEHKNK